MQVGVAIVECAARDSKLSCCVTQESITTLTLSVALRGFLLLGRQRRRRAARYRCEMIGAWACTQHTCDMEIDHCSLQTYASVQASRGCWCDRVRLCLSSCRCSRDRGLVRAAAVTLLAALPTTLLALAMITTTCSRTQLRRSLGLTAHPLRGGRR